MKQVYEKLSFPSIIIVSILVLKCVCENAFPCLETAFSGLKCSTLILYMPQGKPARQGENHGKGRVQKN
jgi:hypothetical protein